VLVGGSVYEAFCVVPGTRRMRPYRYAYTLAAVRPTNQGNALAKHDLQSGTTQLWHKPGAAPGACSSIAGAGKRDRVMSTQSIVVLMCIQCTMIVRRRAGVCASPRRYV
jgi:hypothetical protein